jgi:hypothetical protein
MATDTPDFVDRG